MSIDSLCTTTATIERQTASITSDGANSPSWANVYEDIPCTIQPAKGSIVERFARLSMLVNHVLYTSTEIVLRAGDRVTDTGRTSRTYRVNSFADQGDRARVYAVYLEEIDP